jgi:glycosyltransferase involved in cell wall biosynthesis
VPHICHISTTCNLRSGSAKRTLTILKACIALGYQVTYICGRSHDITPSDLPGGRIIILPVLLKYVQILSDLKALISLVRILRTLQVDLVHTHLAKAGIIGRVASKLAHVPLIVHTVHGPTFATGVRPVKRGFYWLLEKVAAQCTDFFVFVGQDLRRAYIRAHICRNDSSSVIYTGRPSEDFHMSALTAAEKEGLRRGLCDNKDPSLLLLSVGRIVPSKRQGHAIDVLGSICRRGVDARLAIVGQAFLPEEQRYKGHLERRAQYKGVSDRVHFPGFRQDILRVIQAADAVVLTSRYEGLPNIAVEARIAGTPLVSYALPGVKEIIEDGRTGVLVRDGDLHEVEHAILRIFSGETCLTPTIKSGLPDLETQFSLKRMVEKTMRLYQWLIAHSRSRSNRPCQRLQVSS